MLGQFDPSEQLDHSIPMLLPRLSSVLLCQVLLCSCGAVSQHRADLIELKRIIPGICLQIRYATTDNFTHHKVYDSDRCFLRQGTALKLRAVEDELKPAGLGLESVGWVPPAFSPKDLLGSGSRTSGTLQTQPRVPVTTEGRLWI